MNNIMGFIYYFEVDLYGWKMVLGNGKPEETKRNLEGDNPEATLRKSEREKGEPEVS